MREKSNEILIRIYLYFPFYLQPFLIYLRFSVVFRSNQKGKKFGCLLSGRKHSSRSTAQNFLIRLRNLLEEPAIDVTWNFKEGSGFKDTK